nr:hypothetical protein Iba_chr13aCG9930 [Ipomoea batatas]
MYARTLLEYVCKNDSKGYGWANADPDADVVSLSPKTLLESDPCIGGGTRCHGFVEVAEEGDTGVSVQLYFSQPVEEQRVNFDISSTEARTRDLSFEGGHYMPLEHKVLGVCTERSECTGVVAIAVVRDSAWWRLAGVEGLGGVRRGGVVVGIEQTRCSGNRRGGGLAVPSVVVAAEE